MARLYVIQVFKQERENMQADVPGFSCTIKNQFKRNNSMIMLGNYWSYFVLEPSLTDIKDKYHIAKST